ncbi:transketolase family protein [Acetobacterium wieringae]|uniref:Transketolase family protein n=1 Tax=Acetobacterium wieringae TaxID=52694 RepID=A0ABY6HFL7_9FIRM|nr:transketolase family protein [Acetobacterium wieringae]MEA4804281.1 transketolase family protein [Acetobacterium wieringae]UYO63213.1 transketolase family protein [Acetobacterium wieringae]VUZ23772.1 1-deoxy-D-xylulose-5-phosphate synthase [Acetobacterium wieringae]
MAEKKATRQAYGDYLVKLGEKNPNLVVLDADLSGATKTNIFKKAYPERHFNVGIAEANLMGMAAGLATAGKVPFASTFAIFGAGRAYEIIRNSICYPKLNVKIALTHAGISVGEDGGSHQSVEDIALMRVLPNMTVLSPADAIETEKMLEAAMTIEGPVYIRLGRSDVPVLFDESYHFELGKASMMKSGSDVTIIATGLMVALAMEAADQLKEEGISAQVINMGSIKPIDVDAIKQAALTTGAIVTAEEHSIIGGLGGAVAEVLGDEAPVPLERVGVKDLFGQSGKVTPLMEKYGLTANAIVAAAKKAVSRK